MEQKDTLLFKIICIISLPITIPIYLILRLFSTKKIDQHYVNNFINLFINNFNNEIYKLLKVDKLPLIYLNNTNSNTLGVFASPGIFNLNHLFDINNTAIFNRTDNTRTYICINYISIFHRAINNMFLTKLIIIKTLIHELTHYRQYIEDRFVGNYSSTFHEYKKEPCEVEARKVSRRFTTKYLIRVIKFILMN